MRQSRETLIQNIGIQLRDTRQRQGMSQAELAEKAELSTVYISQIESGQKNISVGVLVRLCDALHTTCDDPLRAKLARSENMAYVLGTIFADCTDEELTAVLQLLQDIKSLIELVKTTI